jgi:hypothetical protein
MYCGLQSERLREGFRRVRDPAREADVDGEPREPVLEAAIRDGDLDAALVLADWLQSGGHPRGALIAVQQARESRPDDAALAEEERRLLGDPAIVGPLASWLDAPARLKLDWQRGFIRRARIDGFFSADGEREDLLWEVLRHPSGRFLRALEIGCPDWDQDNVLMSDLLVRAGPTPPLARLVLADLDDSRHYNGIEIRDASIGDLTGLGQRYPALEEVVLEGRGDVVLGELGLPNARRFALRTSGLRCATLRAIEGARWPALEDLEIWFGDREHGASCQPMDLVPLLHSPHLPKLRALRLMNAELTDESVPLVAQSPLAKQLDTLDFSLGTLTDKGARLVAKHRDRFPQLACLRVFACSLTARGIRRLRDAGLSVDDWPAEPAWGEPHRKRDVTSASLADTSRAQRDPACKPALSLDDSHVSARECGQEH